MAQRAVEIGALGCGITDHGNCAGHLDFAKSTAHYGVKPVYGIELYHGVHDATGRERDQAHLIALAKTSEGLRNLWRLINQTGRNDHFHYVGRVFWDDLEKFHEGIVFTSACALGLVPREIVEGNYTSLNRYLDIFRDDFYIEISTYPARDDFDQHGSDDGFDTRVYNEALVEIAQERGIPLVYGDDGHYASEDQFEFHNAYLARQTGQTIYTPIEDRKMYHPPNAVVIKDIQMIYDNLSYLPRRVIDEAVDNANEIVRGSSADLPEVRRHMPLYKPSNSPWCSDKQKQLTPEELFIDLVIEGINNRYSEDPNDDKGMLTEEVWERALSEVDTLIRDGIHHYFLMGWDEMKIADSMGIERGPGRGSSGGSIVAYALGITDVCPLHYGLIFERFWNSGRVDGFPDIDSDFSRSRRDEMIQALKDRWGSNRVVSIGTTGYLKPKSVIDKLAPACEITRDEANELKEIVGRTTKIEILGHDQIGWSPEREPGKKYYVTQDVGTDIRKWITAKRDRKDVREYFVEVCEATCSRVSQFGVHASGLVVSDIDTEADLPTQIRGGGKNGVPATMFTMSDVDKLQFVKLDILGLRTLDVLAFWREDMKSKYDIDIEWSGLDRQEHPQEMWDMVKQGLTAGIFQVEDGYGRQLCKRMQPDSIMDLAIIGALNRPGPIQAHIPDEYIARRNGEKPITYPHPRIKELMAPVLDKTYGLWVVQEQIIAFFNVLGYTLSESDAIRKIMGKKKPEQMDAVRDGLEEWVGRGYLEMAQKSGIPLSVAENIWLDLEGFADYCFNLAHSVEYAVITFRTIFAKYFGTAEFYASVIRSLDPSTDGDKRKEILPVIVNECRRMKIDVVPPDIMNSRAHTYAQDDVIHLGFSDIAGVRASAPYLVHLRDEVGLDMSSPQAFRDAFEAYNKDWIKNKTTDPGMRTRSPKQQLTSRKIQALEEVGCWNNTLGNNRTMTEQQDIERRMLDVILTDNSSEVIDRNSEQISHCDSFKDAVKSWSEKSPDLDDEESYIDYRVPGVITGIVERTGRKSGKVFATITIVYEDDELEFTVFNKDWKRYKSKFKLRRVGIFDLRQSGDTQYGPSYILKGGTLLV